MKYKKAGHQAAVKKIHRLLLTPTSTINHAPFVTSLRPVVNELMPYAYDKKRTEEVEGITNVLHLCNTRALHKHVSLGIAEET